MPDRVVVTGLGVCAPNGVGVSAFAKAIQEGTSGITFHQRLADLQFGCQVAGTPQVSPELLSLYFTDLELRGLKATGLQYGVIAGMDAWQDAGLQPTLDHPDYDSGIIFGTGILGVDKFREAIHLIDAGRTRRLGSTAVLQTMASGISAYLSGKLGCGNQVTTNSSACSTGTEAVLMAYDRIRAGKATRMLAGSCGDSGPYIWGGFDAMRILPSQFNDRPEEASRPMDSQASGFVPGSGAGALVLESLASAQARKATIYAEVLGGAVNSGGQRGGGTLTAANDEAVQRCIQEAVQASGVSPAELDAINGHLTATSKDSTEIKNWCEALNRRGQEFPMINSLKGMTGHCLAAAGSIECVATVLQIHEQYVFGNVNCDVLHPEIEEWIAKDRVPTQTQTQALNLVAKASFGFGDVNCCVLFKKF
ncbi:beta-ketoacyl-[acyl-carrier-protein] synthase family protein [Croceiramulus getboli]|nr:beta-ketoacyl-[acyl-carrier-protein] synthase family protein [Flavobacteriaceae bacterium YJPT1-3]